MCNLTPSCFCGLHLFLPVHSLSFFISKNECLFPYHQVILIAQNSLTLTYHPSLSFIALSKAFRLYSVSTQSWCIQVLAGWLTLVCLCVGVYKRTSLISSFLLLQQCPAYFVRLLGWFMKLGAVTIQLLFSGMLLLGFIQNSM